VDRRSDPFLSGLFRRADERQFGKTPDAEVHALRLPLKTWIKSALDQIIQSHFGEPGLEFVWVGDDAVDPLQQAQTLNILVGAGIKSREEARAELGLGGDAAKGLGKYNQNHDERGRFATADGAVGVVGHPARKPQPRSVRVASNDAARSRGYSRS
jgi:hypothetical protein